MFYKPGWCFTIALLIVGLVVYIFQPFIIPRQFEEPIRKFESGLEGVRDDMWDSWRTSDGVKLSPQWWGYVVAKRMPEQIRYDMFGSRFYHICERSGDIYKCTRRNKLEFLN